MYTESIWKEYKYKDNVKCINTYQYEQPYKDAYIPSEIGIKPKYKKGDVLKMSARNFDEIPEVFFISDNYSGKCKRFGQIVEVAEACSNMDSNNNVFHTKYTITVEIGMDCVHLSPTEVFYTDIKDINFEPVTEYFECYEGNFSIDEYKRLIAPHARTQ